MKKLTSKFVRKNCYFILYDYPNDDKIIFYFDNFNEVLNFFLLDSFYFTRRFNECGNSIVCIWHGIKYYLHLFIDEELVAQKS